MLHDETKGYPCSEGNVRNWGPNGTHMNFENRALRSGSFFLGLRRWMDASR